MKKRLFQYAVILHSYDETSEAKIYKDSELIIQPTVILAKDDKEVLFKVTRLIPEDKASNPDNVEIVIRNF